MKDHDLYIIIFHASASVHHMVKYNRMAIVEAERVTTGATVRCLMNARMTIGKRANSWQKFVFASNGAVASTA